MSPPVSACTSDGQSARKRQRLQDGDVENSNSSRGDDGNNNAESSGAAMQEEKVAASLDTSTSSKSSKLIGLRLEAIFHPKFGNENRTTADIRRRMLERVETSKGYLEVSLKHSGSLLLWSGGMRYYSKNSTDNRFAHAGEILLRQHFARAWLDEQQEDSSTNQSDVNEDKYHECSQIVERRRLTLSFEVVTSVLGQHGDIPCRDFLILTAIADRSRGGRFFDTFELVEFAQRFHLPHNDFWLFQNMPSCRGLFDLYDNSRETALADGTIASLSASCDGGHIQSIYPHVTFQGNILEGIVIRYVPYDRHNNGASDTTTTGNTGSGDTMATLQQKTQALANRSEEILKLVPPDRESSFDLPQLSATSSNILRTDIRSLSTNHSGSSFDTALRDSLLNNTNEQRREISFVREQRNKKTSKDLVQMVRDIRISAKSVDPESFAIAKLVNQLEELSIPVEYKLCREKTVNHKDEDRVNERTLCIIHIKSDFAFQKFARKIKDGDMPLYRGFVVRLVMEGETHDEMKIAPTASECPSTAGTSTTTRAQEDGNDALMLKMKFIPYMVRTFGIRNGLPILEKSGSEAYDRYILNLLKAWGVSQDAIEKWQLFFRCWGVYEKMLRTADKADASDSHHAQQLPPLTTETYLQHLGHFSNLYYSGSLDGKIKSSNREAGTLRGIVVVVGLTRQGSLDAADKIAARIGSQRADDINAVTENEMLAAMMQRTGGLVCSAIVEDGMKSVKMLSKKYDKSMYIIFVGCSDDAVEKSLEPGKDLKKRVGMLKGWRKVKCKSVFEWPDPLKMDENIASFDRTIQQSYSTDVDSDKRPGLLVFFPGIPGCGKSFLCNDITFDALASSLRDGPNDGNGQDCKQRLRSINICVGDKVEGKYWSLVRRERMSMPSSVYFADKNAPPTVWSTIGDICAKSRGVPLPVFPDGKALATTTVALGSGKQINFSFSLSYLAVCMQRVLARPHESHCGKLDASCKDACMVVIKFYCLYRNFSAEQLIDRYRREMDAAGRPLSSELVRVPFFAADAPTTLPFDLNNTIEDAIRLQIDIDTSKLEDADKMVANMESRLREALSLHGTEIATYTAKEEESRSSFLAQISKHMHNLDDLELEPFQSKTAAGSRAPSFIKIVSIDVDNSLLRGILKEMAPNDASLSSYLEDIGVALAESVNGTTAKHSGTLVENTHVTMAHFSQLSQIDMRSRFGTIVGKEVELKITACLYGEKNAALSVFLPQSTLGEIPIALPSSKNKYPHITIWYGEGSVAADSNKLPDMVSAGKASMFQPATGDISVRGKLSYWMIDKPE